MQELADAKIINVEISGPSNLAGDGISTTFTIEDTLFVNLCNARDKAVLIDIYRAMSGRNWTPKSYFTEWSMCEEGPSTECNREDPCTSSSMYRWKTSTSTSSGKGVLHLQHSSNAHKLSLFCKVHNIKGCVGHLWIYPRLYR